MARAAVTVLKADRPATARDDGIQVLRRAAAALDEIATAPGLLRLVDLHSRLGLAKSTTRRLLVGLTEVGFAAVDDNGRIILGERLLGLANVNAVQVAATFRPALARIAGETGETADLSIYRAGQMLLIEQIESPHLLRAASVVGTRVPLVDAANGKACLALLDEGEIDRILAPLAAERRVRLRAEVDEIRTSRVAFDRDEHTAGVSAAGIAARTGGGSIVAISVPAPTDRFRAHQTRIVDALRAALDSPAWLG